MKRNRVFYVLFSAAVTVAVFWYLFSHVTPADVLRIIRDSDVRGIALFAVLSLVMSVFRTWRYGLILNAAGQAPGSVALFLVTLVRNLFSDLLPARLGSLIYVYIITGRLGIPFGPAASSFALAFVFDLMAIAPMIGLAVLWIGAGMELPVTGLLVAGGVLLLVVGAVLYALPFLARLAGRVVRGAGVLGERRCARWSEAFFETERDIVRTRKAGVYTRLFVLSLAVRICKYASLYALLYGLLHPLGYGFVDLSVAKVFLGICSSEVAASLPVSGIAGFGMYEGAWSAVFALLGFPDRIAQLTSISHHLVTQVWGYSLGAGALVILLLPLFKGRMLRSGEVREVGGPLRFYGRLVAAILVSALLAAGSYAALKPVAERGTAPEPVEAVGPRVEEAETITLRGRVVFGSNRGRGFGIFSMKADGSDIRVLVDSDVSDIYPDPSPDGRWIAFAKAKSPHRLAPSEIWICSRDGTGARKVADDGTFPTFSADGGTIYFERGRNTVMAVDTDGTGEREVFPGKHKGFSGHKVVKPRVSPDGKWVAFISDRKGRWNTWAVKLSSGEAVHVGHGCEPAWFPDSRSVTWVKGKPARQGSGLYTYDLETGAISELHDDGPPLGHEYFPTVSRDGRFLLWGACPEGQHDHSTSNYQVFVKDLTKGIVKRLTFDTANNRWPKILRGIGNIGRDAQDRQDGKGRN